MKVEKIITSDNKERYLLFDENSNVIKPVLKYIKFKDNSGAARNTLKTYTYHLKLFFEFLKQEQLQYHDIGLDEMATFMRWLKSPHQNSKVLEILPVHSKRSAKTINTIILTVTGVTARLLQ